MPLHLLGKKSWNVYNNDNVERVRRDEAEAQAREEAEEQRMQEEDARRRIAILRREEPAPLRPVVEPVESSTGWREKKDDDTYYQRDRKRRRLRGEDDTERDIRYARQDTATGEKAAKALLKKAEKDAPLEDRAGHIQLFPAPDEVAIRKTEKNAELEAEKEKKRKREEDKITMRFSNAAGYQNSGQKPWYASSRDASNDQAKDIVLAEAQGKDVWGNDDPLRKEREKTRISTNDPFAAMQQAQRQLKQSEKDKFTWEKKQQRELEELKKQQRKEKRRRDVDEDNLDGFSLDAPPERRGSERDRDHKHRHRHHHRRYHSRSRSRERDRERGHSSRRHRDRH
ncbi:hypothetical protein M409DRAFT_62237 [Zasmidium cellare ATCC 36951]|uniref:CBF1-interacting co-repressor CIR N-terminal domain-containing protein n=1 Tax=Zasmidium cellare ATCC 36951 TaxID=1080233 RepID=A0A6A6D775_ZASCE|nr:uncharacterized protein M409DRAFT_62237 [Zasmidium cellare ATCC 36951]KAF2174082.1 hypothetical protein M409DRAFT_62237 [Zasmidium cellare ATCC 36951]